MKIKFKPGEKVKTVSGMEVYINSVNIYSGSITYNVWDGTDKFLNVDEWQIEAYEGNPIGFVVE